MSKSAELMAAALAYHRAHRRHVDERTHLADEEEACARKRLLDAARAYGDAVERV